MNTKNLGHSIREKLLNIAKSQNTDYQVILIRYFHERFLFRLSQSNYRELFCLKGGALLYAYEKFLARPTMDVDFRADKINNDINIICEAVAEICKIVCPEDGVVFDDKNITSEIITEFKDYHGVRIHLNAKLQSISQNISMDFGFGDEIYPSPNVISYPNLLEDMPCAKISTYPLPRRFRNQPNIKQTMDFISPKNQVERRPAIFRRLVVDSTEAYRHKLKFH